LISQLNQTLDKQGDPPTNSNPFEPQCSATPRRTARPADSNRSFPIRPDFSAFNLPSSIDRNSTSSLGQNVPNSNWTYPKTLDSSTNPFYQPPPPPPLFNAQPTQIFPQTTTRNDISPDLPKYCLKSKLFDCYTGKADQNLDRWRTEAEESFRLRKLPFEFWGRIARLHLSGAAREWVCAQDPLITWDFYQLINGLSNEFEIQSFAAAASLFSNCIQHKTESVNAYFRRLSLTLDRAYRGEYIPAKIKDHMVMAQALRGARPDLLERAVKAVSAETLAAMKLEFLAVETHDKISKSQMPRRAISHDPSRNQSPERPGRDRAQTPPPRKIRWDPSVRFLTQTTPSDSNVHSNSSSAKPSSAQKYSLDEVRQLIRADNADLGNAFNHKTNLLNDRIDALGQKLKKFLSNLEISNEISRRNSQNSSPYECFYCGEVGHIQRNCRKRIAREGPNPKTTQNQANLPPYSNNYQLQTVYPAQAPQLRAQIGATYSHPLNILDHPNGNEAQVNQTQYFNCGVIVTEPKDETENPVYQNQTPLNYVEFAWQPEPRQPPPECHVYEMPKVTAKKDTRFKKALVVDCEQGSPPPPKHPAPPPPQRNLKPPTEKPRRACTEDKQLSASELRRAAWTSIWLTIVALQLLVFVFFATFFPQVGAVNPDLKIASVQNLSNNSGLIDVFANLTYTVGVLSNCSGTTEPPSDPLTTILTIYVLIVGLLLFLVWAVMYKPKCNTVYISVTYPRTSAPQTSPTRIVQNRSSPQTESQCLVITSDYPMQQLLGQCLAITRQQSTTSSIANNAPFVQATGQLGFTPGFRCERVDIVVDTGSDVTLVNMDVARKTGVPIEEIPDVAMPYMTVRQAMGSNMTFHGFVVGGLYLAGHVYPARFLIPNAAMRGFDVLLGNDLLEKIGELTIDYRRRRVTLKDPEINAAYIFKLRPDSHDTVISSTGLEFWEVGSAVAPPSPSQTRSGSPSTSTISQPSQPRSPVLGAARNRTQLASRIPRKDQTIPQRRTAMTRQQWALSDQIQNAQHSTNVLTLADPLIQFDDDLPSNPNEIVPMLEAHFAQSESNGECAPMCNVLTFETPRTLSETDLSSQSRTPPPLPIVRRTPIYPFKKSYWKDKQCFYCNKLGHGYTHCKMLAQDQYCRSLNNDWQDVPTNCPKGKLRFKKPPRLQQNRRLPPPPFQTRHFTPPPAICVEQLSLEDSNSDTRKTVKPIGYERVQRQRTIHYPPPPPDRQSDPSEKRVLMLQHSAPVSELPNLDTPPVLVEGSTSWYVATQPEAGYPCSISMQTGPNQWVEPAKCQNIRLAEDLTIPPRTQLVVAVKWPDDTPQDGEFLFEPAQRLISEHGLLAPKAILSPRGLHHSLLCLFNPFDRFTTIRRDALLGIAKPL
jgi:hypothetical protein